MARIVIAAGGTAGHVVPALAVADALRDSGAEVAFVGADRAEAELVPAAGYALHRITVSGIDRRNPLLAARALGRAAAATVRARTILRSERADAVLGGGGYVAGPVGLAARGLGIPLALTEADSHLGVTNRLLMPLAERVFLAFPIVDRDGPKFELVGRPMPADTTTADRAAARERFGIGEHEDCLLVFGGSLGARRINEAALAAFGRSAPCQVLHASGLRDHHSLRQRLDAFGGGNHYHLYPYIEPFADALAAADLAVARAGGSVFELAAAGVPAVLVPYPDATADHQTSNARYVAAAGAAVVVPDSELDGPRLAREIGELLGSPERLAALAAAAASIARPDAARRVADYVLKLAG